MDKVPKSLKHFDYKAVLRKRGIYMKQRQNKLLKEAFKPVIKREIKNSQEKEGYQPPPHAKFSPKEIMDYYEKQIHSVKVIEEHFEIQVNKFLNFVHNKVIDNLQIEIDSKKSVRGKKKALENFKTKDVFDDNEDEFLSQAQIDFTPLLDNLGVIAGQKANSLIGLDDPYLPSKPLKALITENVTKFTKSMLDTDRQHIIDVIDNGIEQGQSIPDIRNTLTDDLDFTKMQSTRITRTEVLRTSNQSALDAWKQSGVVEGKQWITAGADDECADYEGQIESLDNNFYSDTSDFQDGDPPIHPNCKCTLIPIVVDSNS